MFKKDNDFRKLDINFWKFYRRKNIGLVYWWIYKMLSVEEDLGRENIKIKGLKLGKCKIGCGNMELFSLVRVLGIWCYRGRRWVIKLEGKVVVECRGF